MNLFEARVKAFVGVLERELSVAVEVMFPVATFTAAVATFQKQFPSIVLDDGSYREI